MEKEKIIDHEKISAELEKEISADKSLVKEILAKGREMKGIDYSQVLTLLKVTDEDLLNEMYDTAKQIKTEIYGNRLVLFAPLYISNLCNNECLYCAFRRTNEKLVRKALSQEEIKEETEILLEQGHKRVLLVAGEAYPNEGLNYVFKSIESVYAAKNNGAKIRRVNVNVAPLSVSEFKELHNYNIGTYQIFQETYNEEMYKKLHVAGPKQDYYYRLSAIDRAFEAGFDDVGIGVLFGLYDWRYEILATLSHSLYLEKKFGVGPHTISVPRLEPALESDVSKKPPYPVSDEDFKKIIAVLRIAVPYTGIILSTRENPQMRREAFDLGISQISAGSRTNPGGYKHDKTEEAKSEGTEKQFSLGDTRPMEEVIKDVVEHKYIPSFCTGCYRLGRVGKDFMDLAKPGLIKEHCLPNAIFTFAEYLEDYAGDDLKQEGYALIESMTKEDIHKEGLKQKVYENLKQVKEGKRDVYF